MKPHRYHVGTRTTAFDVLEDDLIVTEHVEGVGGGKVVAHPLVGGAAPVEAAHLAERARGGGGFRAFAASPDVIYRIEGIEWRPVLATRFVRFVPGTGFVEMTGEAAAAAVSSAAAIEMPPLSGQSESAIGFATRIRERARVAVLEANRCDLLARLARRTHSGYFLARKHHTAQQWVSELSRESLAGVANN